MSGQAAGTTITFPVLAGSDHDFHEQHTATRRVGPRLPMDDVEAALGSFAFHAVPFGDARVYLRNNVPWVRVRVLGAYIYMHDSFDFNGDQSGWIPGLGDGLGYWKTSPPAFSSVVRPGYTFIDNVNFRQYRDRYGVGGDYRIMSDIETVRIPGGPRIFDFRI